MRQKTPLLAPYVVARLSRVECSQPGLVSLPLMPHAQTANLLASQGVLRCPCDLSAARCLLSLWDCQDSRCVFLRCGALFSLVRTAGGEPGCPPKASPTLETPCRPVMPSSAPGAVQFSLVRYQHIHCMSHVSTAVSASCTLLSLIVSGLSPTEALSHGVSGGRLHYSARRACP